MDFDLSPEQISLREESMKLAKKFDYDYWYKTDNDAAYPWDFVKAFRENDYLGMMIPEEYGGAGAGVVDAALMLHSIAASGAGTSGAAAIHFYMFPPAPIINHGSEEMKRKYLPKIAAGELLMAFGVTEPTAGTDTSRIKTRAERQEDGTWLISGQKVWTTNAQNAHKILLLCRTSPRDPDHPYQGMTLFFVDLDRTYCDIRVIPKLGRAAVDSNEVFIDSLPATDADIVGEVGQGFKYLLDGLNSERVVVAMVANGIGRASLELAVKYAKDRVVFDRPIGQNQAIAHPLAKAWAKLEAAELMCLKAGWLYDNGLPCAREANAAMLLSGEAGFFAADAALQTHGGFGYAKEYHIERLWREVRLARLAPISEAMILNYISQNILGLPRSY
jgi:acyl-CoA dehydrogenase